MSDEKRTRWNSTLPAPTRPLSRGVAPQRKVRPRKVNKARRGHRFPKVVDESFRRWIRERPCLLRLTGECRGDVEPDHAKTRGAGGADRKNLNPLCHYHHDRRHTMGRKSFEAHYQIDLTAAALELDEWYTERIEEAF